MISEYDIKIYMDDEVIGFAETMMDKPHPYGLPGELDTTRIAVYTAKVQGPENFNVVKHLQNMKTSFKIVKFHRSGKSWTYDGCWIKDIGQTFMTESITVSADVVFGYFRFFENIAPSPSW